MHKPWICPRCDRVYSPYVLYCACRVQSNNTNISQPKKIDQNSNKCLHDWKIYQYDPSGNNDHMYICIECGKIK